MEQRDTTASRRSLDLTAAKRSRHYRARKLIRQRTQVESIYRDRLERLYSNSNLHTDEWVLGTEFFGRIRRLFGIDFDRFCSAVRIDPGIETASLHLDGGSVLLIRPKYFLKGKQP